MLRFFLSPTPDTCLTNLCIPSPWYSFYHMSLFMLLFILLDTRFTYTQPSSWKHVSFIDAALILIYINHSGSSKYSSSLFVQNSVRVSPVALWLGSKMDPYQRDLTNILHSYLVSDSFGPVLGARAWSCKTTERLPRLTMTPEYFGNLRREMSQVATRTFNVLYYFPFIWFIGSHYPRSYI